MLRVFVKRHFSSLFPVVGLLLAAVGLFRSAQRINPLETLIDLKGHIKSMTIQPGPTPEKNSFEFHFEEHKQAFHAVGIKPSDQDLMSRIENKGDLFKFSVLKSEFKNPKFSHVEIYELNTANGNYLNQGSTVEYVQKWRSLAKLMALACVFAFFYYAARVWRRWSAVRVEVAKKEEALAQAPPAAADAKGGSEEGGVEETFTYEPLDSLLIFLTRRPYRFIVLLAGTLGVWMVLAFGADRLLWIAQGWGIGTVFAMLLMSILHGRLEIFDEVRTILENNEKVLKKRPDTEMPTELRAIAELANSPEGVDKVDANGQTALHAACSSGKTEVIEMLLRAGARINKKDGTGKTPLILAVERNQLGAVIKLLDRGADATVKDSQNLTALAYAQKSQKEAIIAAVSKASNEKPKIHLAAQSGKMDELVQLLKGGADIEHPDSSGNTPLMLAVKGNHLGAARMLIEMGAKLDAANAAMQTPLHIAVDLKKPEMILLLKNPPAPKPKGEPKADAKAKAS